MAINVLAKKRGWGYDTANNRLNVYVDGVEMVRFSSTQASVWVEFNKTLTTIGTYNDMIGMNLTVSTALTTGTYTDILFIGHYGASNIDSGAFYFPLWIDINGSGTNSGTFYMARFSVQSSAPMPTAYIQFQSASPGPTHLFEIAGDFAPWTSGGTDCSASSSTDPRGTISIREPDGTTCYIRVWTAK